MTMTTRERTGRKKTMFNLQCSPGDGVKVNMGHVFLSSEVQNQFLQLILVPLEFLAFLQCMLLS